MARHFNHQSAGGLLLGSHTFWLRPTDPKPLLQEVLLKVKKLAKAANLVKEGNK